MNVDLTILERYPQLYKATLSFADRIEDGNFREIFLKCCINTLTTTVKETEEDIYLITGDIDAMWLRDSSAQVIQYLELSPETPDTRRLIKGLVKRQCYYICCDPYANAFNFEWNNNGHAEDLCSRLPIVMERKFEIDSLCYPLFLSKRYYDKTKDKTIFDGAFFAAAEKILQTLETERDHSASAYYHYRPTEADELSVPNKGRGGKCAVTGMIWSGYRASDDPCVYGYNIPENMFAVTQLKALEEIAKLVGRDDTAFRARALYLGIESGIKNFGVIDHPKFGKMYAYETDGLGNYNLMDDANLPNLLGLPYIGWCDSSDETYLNTRAFCLSECNPYYRKGDLISGIGSPHTPGKYVWPISLMTEGLTCSDADRINQIVKTLLNTTADTGYMHESINADDDKDFSRPWFAWANSLFAYFIITKADIIDGIKPLKED